jgi:transposase/ribosomal protein S20
MRRKETHPVFKPYVQNQLSLMPARLDELIPEDHLVRVINRAIDQLDLEPLLKQYKGGGTSSFHPGMMLKVIVYAYSEKVYSSRRIAKALRENVNFMWISGRSQPDFRTINHFRSSRMKLVIDDVFALVMEYLVEAGYVKLENYFLDGTKIEANANKHKVVWEKRRRKYHGRLQEKIRELLQEIDEVNAAENAEYGDKDLEEMGGSGGGGGMDAGKLAEKMAELNRRLAEQPENKLLKQAVKTIRKDYLPRMEKYEEQERKLAGRSSYSKTDEDATCMRMKEDRGAEKPWPKPAYNIQVGTEEQFVVGFSIHQRAGDTSCMIPHLEQVRARLGRLPKNIITDAGYGSEENYDYVERHQLGNFVKYNTFHKELQKHRKPELLRKKLFLAENFPYDPEQDEFTCPAQKHLTYRHTVRVKSDNGYIAQRREYECAECADCPLRSECTKAKGNRRIRVSFRLQRFRAQARDNLQSPKGKALRARRSVEVETVFGHSKHNMGLRRFTLRGKEKVHLELGLHCIAHNMKKLCSKEQVNQPVLASKMQKLAA